MEALQCDIHMTGEHVIVSRGAGSLWCSRRDGSLKPGSIVTPDNLQSARNLGKCYGLMGKIQFFSGSEWKLLLIGSVRSVGDLPLCGPVYCIQRLIIIPLTTDSSPEILGLEGLRDPSPSPGRKGSLGKSEGGGGGGGGGPGGSSNRLREDKEKDKLERRLMEALLRMFNDSQSFYFSVEGDITHTQQRKMGPAATAGSSRDDNSNSDLPFWEKVDDRFFWNKWMLQDLLDITCQRVLVEPWILPVVQGYVEIRTLVLHSNNPPNVLQTSQREPLQARSSELGERGGEKRGEGDHEEGEEEEEEEKEQGDMITFSPKLDFSSSHLLVARGGGTPIGYRGEGSGYETDNESSEGGSSCDSRGGEEGEEGKGERGREGGSGEDSLGVQLEDRQMLTVSVNEPPRDGEERGEVRIQLSEEPSDIKKSPEGASGKGRRPLLERLKLTRRSNSPERGGREEGEGDGGAGIMMTVRRGLLGLNGERLAVVGRRGGEGGEMCESGEFGEGRGVAGESGEGGDTGVGETEEKEQPTEEGGKNDDYCFTLALVSRRSRHRAGTRYRRRGVDPLGKVANLVETEMILQAGSHHASYVLVRGSVPVFWTQPGTKYRPPPIIERGEEETQEAFKKHFEEQFSLYNHVAIASLINQSGRESVLGEAFKKHVLALDDPNITYVTFDFHRHFKADQNGAIQRLVTATRSLNKKFKFCWVDTNVSSGPLCRQDGVFRVNCMDCLDRTNVVQTAFCKEVLQSALQKLGIIPFDEHLSGAMLTTYKLMWASNGDCISRQYTGTDAMKGDLTRYGERKFSGMMKDGYNSAHRYYQNLFRDSYRQVLIDLMQGVPHSEAFSSLPPSLRGKGGEEEEEEAVEEELWSLDREQAIAEMVQLCREELFPTKTLTVVGWALVEAAGYSFLEGSRKEEDCVVLQCREQNQLCVASYNVEDDQVNCFIRIPMEKVEKIVIGPLGTILRSSQKRLHMRLCYTLMDSRQCYFTLKTVNFTSMEEDRDILLSIASTLSSICANILVQEQKLTKKKSPVHQGVIYLVMPKELAWEETLLSRTNRAKEKGGDGGDSVEEGEMCEEEEEEEDEREQSLSMPASPTLPKRPVPTRRIQRLRSQSFDDIISSVNNEDSLLPPPSITTADHDHPGGHVRARNFAFETTPPLDSGSDSGTEPLPRRGLGTAYDHTQLVSSQPEMVSSEPSSSSARGGGGGGGRLNQLRGKLLGRVRQGQGQQKTHQSLEVPLQQIRPHLHDIPSDAGPDIGGTGDSATVEETITTAPPSSQPQQGSQVTNRLLAVGQRFRNAPPSLLRRMGVVSGGSGQHHVTQAPPPILQHNDVANESARRKSNSNFISL